MTAPHDLSGLEMEIVRALARGLQSKEIASEVDRSRTTIEYHIRLLFVKMDATSRAQLVARGYELGLLQGPAIAPSSMTALRA